MAHRILRADWSDIQPKRSREKLLRAEHQNSTCQIITAWKTQIISRSNDSNIFRIALADINIRRQVIDNDRLNLLLPCRDEAPFRDAVKVKFGERKMNSSDVGIALLISELKWAESINFTMGNPSKGSSVLDSIIPGYGRLGELNGKQATEVHKRLDRCAGINQTILEMLKERSVRMETAEMSSRANHV